MAYARDQLLTALLRDVSRSFYLTLRVLPAPIRTQIGLAYLLARTTDTIADTALVPVEERLGALEALKHRLLGWREGPLDFGEVAHRQGTDAERALLVHCEEALGLLAALSSADLQLVRDVLVTIISGQALDLRRFRGASAHHVVALGTDTDLEDYTYRVAGCVGEFWTRICRTHLFPAAPLDEASLVGEGVRFGKGLQLVNILRDLPVDLRQGRCYLPAERLLACGLKQEELLAAHNEPRLRTLYAEYLDRAEGYLAAGWNYTNSLPRRCVRLRLACAWPLLIGRRTLQLLRTRNVLDHEHRIKLPRWQVQTLLVRSILFYPWPRQWERLFIAPSSRSPKRHFGA